MFPGRSRLDVTDETLFLAHLPLITDVVLQVCRRHHMSAAETEEFLAEFRLHLIEHTYGPLKKFEGRCSFRTYLTVLVQHFFHDYRNRLWGKWRPSAAARRLGPTGVLLERLVTRDGWTVEQAIEIIQTNHQVVVDDRFATLVTCIAKRQPPRQTVPERDADEIDGATQPPDWNVLSAERGFLAKRVHASLERARQTLPAIDRLVLKMLFDDGMAAASVARTLQLDQTRLYRDIKRIFASLRKALEAEGLTKEEIRELFADGRSGEGDDWLVGVQVFTAPGASQTEKAL